MDCLFNSIFVGNQNFGLTLIICSRIHRRLLMRNLPHPSQQYSKCHTRVEEIEKCLDEGLELTYYSGIFITNNPSAFITYIPGNQNEKLLQGMICS